MQWHLVFFPCSRDTVSWQPCPPVPLVWEEEGERREGGREGGREGERREGEEDIYRLQVSAHFILACVLGPSGERPSFSIALRED